MNKSSANEIDLPSNFRFCISTAAHQIEGNNDQSDWWQWELTPGHIKNGDTSAVATDSWNHVDEDIQNIKSLGVDDYRFSIEWAKIEPKPHEFNLVELDRYVGFIDKLKAAGISPMLTLYHFTLPIWVANQGGWQWDGIADAFDEFVNVVAKRIGSRVTMWNTLNEPMTIITAGYMSNVFPPALNNPKSIAQPMINMIKAHARAYHSLHQILDTADFKPRVGLAHHLRIFDPKHSHNPIDRYLARKFDAVFNWAIPEALDSGYFNVSIPFMLRASAFIPEAIGTQDFFGLNYYSRDRINFNLFEKQPLVRSVTPGADLTDLGWEIYPEGMGRIIDKVHDRYPKLSIYLTENGMADATDVKRIPFVREHLKEISSQIKNGVKVEGYCHWTLNDNFEWAEGYAPKFGLFALEPGTLKRIPKPSAALFSSLIQETKQNPDKPLTSISH